MAEWSVDDESGGYLICLSVKTEWWLDAENLGCPIQMRWDSDLWLGFFWCNMPI